VLQEEAATRGKREEMEEQKESGKERISVKSKMKRRNSLRYLPDESVTEKEMQ
jgi:hypothetical protein